MSWIFISSIPTSNKATQQEHQLLSKLNPELTLKHDSQNPRCSKKKLKNSRITHKSQTQRVRLLSYFHSHQEQSNELETNLSFSINIPMLIEKIQESLIMQILTVDESQQWSQPRISIGTSSSNLGRQTRFQLQCLKPNSMFKQHKKEKKLRNWNRREMLCFVFFFHFLILK